MTTAEPFVRRASHVDPEPALERRMIDTLLEIGPGMWVAHIVDGVLCRGVDTLGQPGAVDADVNDARDDLVRLSRLLSMFTIEQAAYLDAARTGSLIRVVVDGEGGSAYCYAVLVHEHVVGVRIAPAGRGEGTPDPAVEHAMGELATTLRSDIGLPDLNPGGVRDAPAGTAGPSGPYVVGDPPDDTWGTARAATDTAVLHWIGLVRGDELVASADHFGSPELAGYFHLIAPGARRKVYAELAQYCEALFDQLDRIVDDTITGSVTRVVLDVEQGAIVLHRLPNSDDEFLAGITLDQRRVADAESRIADLVRCWNG